MFDFLKRRKDDKKDDKKDAGKPESVVVEDSDQEFIERILAETKDEQAPPLPPRVNTPDISWDSGSESDVPVTTTRGVPAPAATVDEAKDEETKDKGKEKEKDKDDKEKTHKYTYLLPFFHKKKKATDTLSPSAAAATIDDEEVEKEAADLSSILDKLNLGTKGEKAISLSVDTSEVVRKFTLVFKDLVNGVPTAYDDLMALIEDHDGVLSSNYDKLPGSLKKLIMTLPTKLTSTLAPELLAVAAEAQGLKAPGGPAGAAELKGAAKEFMTMSNITKLVTKPGAIASMLKGIVNALKVRWPAFMGTNVLWAVSLSILMFVLWYCHKRGKEARMEQEMLEGGIAKVDDKDRITEVVEEASGSTAGAAAGPSVSVSSPTTTAPK